MVKTVYSYRWNGVGNAYKARQWVFCTADIPLYMHHLIRYSLLNHVFPLLILYLQQTRIAWLWSSDLSGTERPISDVTGLDKKSPNCPKFNRNLSSDPKIYRKFIGDKPQAIKADKGRWRLGNLGQSGLHHCIQYRTPCRKLVPHHHRRIRKYHLE